MRIALGGCGDVGLRLARRLRDAGHAVLALRRRPQASEPGIEFRAVDLCRLGAGELVDWDADAAVSLVAPERRDPAAYRQAFLDAPLALHAACPGLARTLVVTSTASVGGRDGEFSDEDSGGPYEDWRGELLAAIETELASRIESLLVACPSGLYGPGRAWMLRRARALEAGEPRWTHRIHVDDAAAALHHLLQLQRPAPRYCLTDDVPTLECDVLAWLRQQLDLPAVERPAGPEHGRRISNRRLRDSGFRFRYPDYRSGYAELLQDAAAHRV